MGKILGVLFDLDGTLLDTHDLILSSMRYATQKVLGKELSEDVLMAKVGQPLETQMLDFTDSAEVAQLLTDTYREHNHAHHDQIVRVYPDVPGTMAQLHERGLALGVVTSKRHALALRGLRLFGLDAYLDCLVGPDDWPEHKPAPGPVKYGCELLKLPYDQVLYVGDSPFDMQAGNGAGCPTAAALWGMFPQEVLEAQHPAHLLSCAADLLPLLA